MASKNQIADRMYDCEFDDLTLAEKAAVTRAYNAQTAAPRAATAPRVAPRATSGMVSVEIARIGNGPAQKFVLEPGKTVQDLVSKSGFGLDTKKEGVIAHSTGLSVRLSDALVSGETYVISPEIKSA